MLGRVPSHSTATLFCRTALGDPHKANQDAYAVSTGFAGRDSDAFFSVFDGHGEAGDKCAELVRKKLPKHLAEAVVAARAALPPGAAGAEADLSEDACHEVVCRVHREVNAKLHAKKDIDDRMSGTTAVALYLHGAERRITVSNVGDSRAVVGRAAGADGGGGLKAVALTWDQTPYRLDERVRLRKAGSRILTLDQLEGLAPIDPNEKSRDEERLQSSRALGADKAEDLRLGEEIDEKGDPPRVFDSKENWPGCAFSRSLGDSVGQGLGVIPDPEVTSRALTPEDRLLVLASDGVFEFLTNQAVVDMCVAHADPLEACQAIVKESYGLWLEKEKRADDITIICIYLDGIDESEDSVAQIPSVED